MKNILPALFLTTAAATAQTYTALIRQTQLATGVQRDMPGALTGANAAAMLPIEAGGSRFDLYAVSSSPLASHLIDTKTITAYDTTANLAITTPDPYAAFPRTRADQGFTVAITVGGLLSGASDPVDSKSVKLYRHLQAYGTSANRDTVDRSQASLHSQASITQNGTTTLAYNITSIPGDDRQKVYGEERFTVYSVDADGNADQQLSSQFVTVYPVATASISGIAEGETIRFNAPSITITYNDLYPGSDSFLQIYPGPPVEDKIVPRVTGGGPNKNTSESATLSNVSQPAYYQQGFTQDGQWTMEVVSATPFGIEKLARVSFYVKRSLKMNSMVTSME